MFPTGGTSLNPVSYHILYGALLFNPLKNMGVIPAELRLYGRLSLQSYVSVLDTEYPPYKVLFLSNDE